MNSVTMFMTIFGNTLSAMLIISLPVAPMEWGISGFGVSVEVEVEVARVDEATNAAKTGEFEIDRNLSTMHIYASFREQETLHSPKDAEHGPAAQFFSSTLEEISEWSGNSGAHRSKFRG